MEKRIHVMSKLLAVIVSIAMVVTMLPAGMMILASEASAASADSISAPRVTPDKTTWDCVYFGSYPQIEIVDTASMSGCYGKVWAENGDYEVNSSLYSQLQSATYDGNGNTTIDGVKYRRIKLSDATYASGDDDFHYKWSDGTTYHYFRYDKIKWRVIEKNGDEAMLLADIALDDQLYHRSCVNVTWAESAIRSWLKNTFLARAFTASEQSAITTATIANDNNITRGTPGGAGTTDKVFLLSEKDVWNTDKAVSHGFVKANDTYAKQRRAKSSTYAKAMGISSESMYRDRLGNCYWWLRSPGSAGHLAANVAKRGSVDNRGTFVNDCYVGVRPALYLNLKSDIWSYAGTVDSDGRESQIITTSQDSYIKAYGDPSFNLGASAKTALSYSSSNDRVATVSNSGQVTVKDVGTATITITAVETADYKSAKKDVTVTINKGENVITTSRELYEKACGDPVFSLGASAKTALKYKSSNGNVALVNKAGKVVIIGSGETDIVITAAENDKYKSATKTVKVKVYKSANVIKVPRVEYYKGIFDKPFNLKARAKTDLTYESSDVCVATVSKKGLVTVRGTGTAIIKITAARTSDYLGAEKEITVNVHKAKNSITIKRFLYMKSVDDEPFYLDASAKTEITYESSDEKVAKVTAGGYVSIIGEGIAIIKVKAAETEQYRSAEKRIFISVHE